MIYDIFYQYQQLWIVTALPQLNCNQKNTIPRFPMYSLTENGAVTLVSSGDPLMDFFFRLGASRTRSEEDILKDFQAAWENPNNRLYTLRALFYARDVRGGQGERRLFRICLKWLAQNYPEVVKANLDLIPEYGRWDDAIELIEFPYVDATVAELIRKNIALNDRLLFKWLPREKSSKKSLAATIRRFLRLTPKEYRKLLANGTKVVETQMCASQWSNIEYNHVPSRAMSLYKLAYSKRDNARFTSYVEGLATGKSKVNASVLYPYEVIKPFLPYGPSIIDEDLTAQLAQAQWEALPNYISGSNSMIAVCDVSGSMYGLPLEVSISLGMYLAERNTGPFANKFITFTDQPTLITLKGSIREKIQTCMAHVGYNTDLFKVFKTILAEAIAVQAKPEDLPQTILVISDMEFDLPSLGTKPVQKHIEDLYHTHGYEPPRMVYWNVAAHSSSNVPVGISDENVALVSGFSPSIMKYILAASDFSPIGIAMKTLDSDRYADIKLPE
jgi:hypothetical protein